jgi:hypothetical protein
MFLYTYSFEHLICVENSGGNEAISQYLVPLAHSCFEVQIITILSTRNAASLFHKNLLADLCFMNSEKDFF